MLRVDWEVGWSRWVAVKGRGMALSRGLEVDGCQVGASGLIVSLGAHSFMCFAHVGKCAP